MHNWVSQMSTEQMATVMRMKLEQDMNAMAATAAAAAAAAAAAPIPDSTASLAQASDTDTSTQALQIQRPSPERGTRPSKLRQHQPQTPPAAVNAAGSASAQPLKVETEELGGGYNGSHGKHGNGSTGKSYGGIGTTAGNVDLAMHVELIEDQLDAIRISVEKRGMEWQECVNSISNWQTWNKVAM